MIAIGSAGIHACMVFNYLKLVAALLECLKYFILLLLYSLTEALVRLKDPLEQSISGLV